MSKTYMAALVLAAAGCLFSLAPVIGRDLPFAPLRSKNSENAIFVSPFTHEAVTATLDVGWTPGEQIEKANKFRLMQFVPPGQTGDEASTFINVAAYLDVPAEESARTYMMNSKKQFEKWAPKDKVQWTIISDTSPDDVIFEYSVSGWQGSPDQYELQRALRGKDGIHVIIYHLSKPQATDEERQKMLSWLKKVRLIEKEEVSSTARGTKPEVTIEKKPAGAATAAMAVGKPAAAPVFSAKRPAAAASDAANK